MLETILVIVLIAAVVILSLVAWLEISVRRIKPK
jgi:hypothetical protein